MINQRQIKNAMFVTLTEIKAAVGRDTELCFCIETNTWYKYISAGSAYTADDKRILITGNGGNTRWLGIAGKYTINSVSVSESLLTTTDATAILTLISICG